MRMRLHEKTARYREARSAEVDASWVNTSKVKKNLLDIWLRVARFGTLQLDGMGEIYKNEKRGRIR